MPMTDAPNFGTKFGRRKPCLRYIGPLLRTTSVASVGRGDLTPPLPRRTPPPQVCANASVGGGLRPAPLGEVRFRVNFRYFGTPSPRVGADLCVRPWAGPAKDRGRADTSVGPYRSS